MYKAMSHKEGHALAPKCVDLARGGGGVDMPAVEGKEGWKGELEAKMVVQ